MSTPVFLGKRNIFLFTILQTLAILLIDCKRINQEYSVQDQYNLARSRIEGMQKHLGFTLILEKESIYRGEAIFFTTRFTNNTDNSLILRVPQQAGILDIDHPNTTLLYSIIPLDPSISLETPLASLGSIPYIFPTPVHREEFEVLEPHRTKDVRLQLPNLVYLEQGARWEESHIPPGQYRINIVYENLYIGYEVEKEGEIYFRDIFAWVGRIEAEPILLKVMP